MTRHQFVGMDMICHNILKNCWLWRRVSMQDNAHEKEEANVGLWTSVIFNMSWSMIELWNQGADCGNVQLHTWWALTLSLPLVVTRHLCSSAWQAQVSYLSSDKSSRTHSSSWCHCLLAIAFNALGDNVTCAFLHSMWPTIAIGSSSFSNSGGCQRSIAKSAAVTGVCAMNAMHRQTIIWQDECKKPEWIWKWVDLVVWLMSKWKHCEFSIR